MPFESTLPVFSNGNHLRENPESGSVTQQDAGNSKAIKYKILYKNDAGGTIQEDEQYKPWPKLTIADEDDSTDTDSVLEIITHVTIRNISVGTRVRRRYGAAAAGKPSTSSENDPEAEPVYGNHLKSQNLEISSIGSTEMVIRSKELCRALRELVDYYPSQQLAGMITVSEPYHFLLHHRGVLREMMENMGAKCEDGTFEDHQPKKTRADIKVLLAFLDAKYAKKIEDEEARHKKNPPTATFEMIWMLLKPGTRVYTDMDGELAAFVIRSTATDNKINPSWYNVGLWYLNCNGEKYGLFSTKNILNIGIGRRVGRCSFSVTVTSFSGEREVSSLKIFPADMASDKGLRTKLEFAGERYFNVLRKGSEQVNYDGHSLSKIKRYVSDIHKISNMCHTHFACSTKGESFLIPLPSG